MRWTLSWHSGSCIDRAELVHRSNLFPTPAARYSLHLYDSNMLSGILIFNQKGENLIFRAFRNDCRPRLADVFRIQVISNAQVRSPILTLGSTTFSHVKHENIYLVAVTKSNANAALVFEFLYRFVGLGKAYFGKFDEEAVKNNFVLVYELLDEILDFGYPQNTETDTLKMYITTEGVKSERAMVGFPAVYRGRY
jgi:AP-2 complex subunit mu-1